MTYDEFILNDTTHGYICILIALFKLSKLEENNKNKYYQDKIDDINAKFINIFRQRFDLSKDEVVSILVEFERRRLGG